MSKAWSEEAESVRPKKPNTPYLEYRVDKLKELGDNPDRNVLAKKAWDDLAQDKKDKMNLQFKADLQKFKVDKDVWAAKYKISAEDLKVRQKAKSKKNGKDTDDQEKPVKTKGQKSKQKLKKVDKTPVVVVEEKKKEKSAQKPAKSKKEDLKKKK